MSRHWRSLFISTLAAVVIMAALSGCAASTDTVRSDEIAQTSEETELDSLLADLEDGLQAGDTDVWASSTFAIIDVLLDDPEATTGGGATGPEVLASVADQLHRYAPVPDDAPTMPEVDMPSGDYKFGIYESDVLAILLHLYPADLQTPFVRETFYEAGWDDQRIEELIAFQLDQAEQRREAAHAQNES